MQFNKEIFELFDKKWALVTAGCENDFNTMTISWGGLGTLWNKPVATVYVRTSRFTHDFMDREDLFTVSFYPESCRKTLGVLGARSGREMDKIRASGLTPKAVGESVTFAEAEATLVCRKLLRQRLDPADLPPEVVSAFYGKEAPHDMYIGEVVDII